MLRIHVSKKWEPQDYLNAISAVEAIYYITVFADRLWFYDEMLFSIRKRYREPYLAHEYFVEEFLKEARSVADTKQRLIVNEIRHASPGFIDFDGIGEIAKAMDQSLGRIIDVFSGRKRRKEFDKQEEIRTDIIRENLNAIKIENARKLLELHKDYPEIASRYPIERALVDEQNKIENLAARGMITGRRDHGD